MNDLAFNYGTIVLLTLLFGSMFAVVGITFYISIRIVLKGLKVIVVKTWRPL